MGSDAPYELIEGELVRVSPSAMSSNLVLNYINWQLYGFVRARQLGKVSVAEAGFLVERDPDTVVAPDIAYVANGRMPDPLPERGYVAICPDLIIEVVSPTDERGDIQRKQGVYDRIKVPLVWWIDPRRETATVYVAGRRTQVLDRRGTLDGAPVLPGFVLELESVFSER